QVRGHPSLLVDDKRARAVRCESAAAVRYWWGVSVGGVWRWHTALGMGCINSPGARRLILAASALGADQTRGVGLPPRACRPALGKGAGRQLRGVPTPGLPRAALDGGAAGASGEAAG